jgi:HEAT repeat protein
LGNIGAGYPEAVSALTAAIKDPDAGARAEVILSLLKIGPAAKEAVPSLAGALKDRDPKVREYAQKALDRVQGS